MASGRTSVVSKRGGLAAAGRTEIGYMEDGGWEKESYKNGKWAAEEGKEIERWREDQGKEDGENRGKKGRNLGSRDRRGEMRWGQGSGGGDVQGNAGACAAQGDTRAAGNGPNAATTSAWTYLPSVGWHKHSRAGVQGWQPIKRGYEYSLLNHPPTKSTMLPWFSALPHDSAGATLNPNASLGGAALTVVPKTTRSKVGYMGWEQGPPSGTMVKLEGVGHQPKPMDHKKWNKLIHIMVGNTSTSTIIELMSLNVRGMMVPLEGGGDVNTPRHLKMIEEIEAYISLRKRPALLALQECGGGWAEMQLLAERLKGWGYDCAFEPGECATSGHDKHRHGGVLLGWQQREFRAKEGRTTASTVGGGANPKSRRVTVLVSSCGVKAAVEAGDISTHVAQGLEKYIGRRAMAVQLVRRRGPRANEERVHAVAYVPAAAPEAIKTAFIREVGRGILRVAGDSIPFTLAGDWQAAPFPAWRALNRPNKVHENALKDAFFDLQDEDGALTQSVGRPVAFNLAHEKGEFSFHSPAGFHATIDHIFTDRVSAVYTKSNGVVPSFLGSRSEGHDEYTLFDHRVLVAQIVEGQGESLGRQRPKAMRLRGNPAEISEYLKRLPTETDLEADDDAALGDLEDRIAATAVEVRRRFTARSDIGRRKSPDSEEVQLRYLEGLYSLVVQAYDDECSESWGRALFGAKDSNHLYQDKMSKKARDRHLQRAGRRAAWRVSWKSLRDECEHALRNAITRLVPIVKRRKRELSTAIDLGVGAAFSAETFARQLQAKQAVIAAGDRAAGFSLTALQNAEGRVVNTPAAVHKVAHDYGRAQNRESRCDEALTRGWLRTFVPRGETLSLPDGSAWSFRGAVPYPVFCREMRRVKKNKAGALHPFLIDHLHRIPDEHPTLKLYYELFMRCLEAGRFLEHYRELAACFIPKTYGDVFELGCLRDIWLINHGAKLSERMMLHLAIAPMNSNVLLCHAGGCKGRGCVDQAFALHATIADAVATKRNIFVMYVDLIKCFMSFSRSAGRSTAAHAGLPEEVVRAMKGLVDCAIHGKATGQYMTAFGSTEPFEIMRGFLQGALASPEMCKLMMNTLAEALELKIVGYELYAPNGEGAWMTQLVFVDNAANITNSAAMMRRVALFWSVWLRIGDTQANIAALKKTVVSGMTWKTRKDGSKVAVSCDAAVYIGGLNEGDEPRRVPNLKISGSYRYVGMATRLDGQHNDLGLATLKAAVARGASQAASRPTSRCLAIATANCYTMGSSFFYGSVFGGSASYVEEVLGPTSRRACRWGMVRGRRRPLSAPAVQLHAPAKPMVPRRNDPMSSAAAERGRGLAGYGVAHPYPGMAAASAMTFHNNIGAPLPTPANLAAISGLARVLHEFGCRANPSQFDFENLMDVLDQSDMIERAVWLLSSLNQGKLDLVAHFRTDCAMHERMWPGYPPGWVDLWKGPLWVKLKLGTDDLQVSRTLMRAGVSELANVCTEDGEDFMSWSLIQLVCPQVVHEHPGKTRQDYEALVRALQVAGVEPVAGRRAWAAADAIECLKPACDEEREGERGSGLVCDEEAQRRKEERVEQAWSGDGGCALATVVGLKGRPEWTSEAEGDLGDEDTTQSHGAREGLGQSSGGRGNRASSHGVRDSSSAGDGDASDVGNTDRAHGDRVHGDRVHGDRIHGDRVHGDRVHGDRVHGDRVHGNGVRGDRVHGDRVHGDRVHGDRAQGDRVHGDGVHGDRVHGDRVHGDRAPGSPYGARREAAAGGGEWPPMLALAALGYGTADMIRPAGWEGVQECTSAALAIHPFESTVTGEVALCTADRVLRARDAFGVLDLAIGEASNPPTDAEVARAFEEVRDALHHQAREENSELGRVRRRTVCASACVNWAVADLADRSVRAAAYFAAMEEAKRSVTWVRCPVDVAELRRFARTDAAVNTTHSRTGVRLSVVALELVSKVGSPDREGVARVEITYRHSFVGARLIAAGHVAFSRLYAIERHDPFTCPREVRKAALGRFGFDLDDKSAYPTAMAAIFERGKRLMALYLSNKEKVLAGLAVHFFGVDGAPGEGAVKQLFNSMDMGGGPVAWVEEHRSLMREGATVEGAEVEIGGGEVVSVKAYKTEQVQRVEELRERAPRLVEAVRRLNVKRDPSKREELTAMSYLLQHYEGASREAKRAWLACRGCRAFSLQHDGVMASLVRGMDPSQVADRLGVAASAAVGYEVRVEVKSSPAGDDSLAFGPRPQVRLTPSHPASGRVGEEDDAELGLSEAAAEAFVKAMGTSSKRTAGRLTLPGPDQLTVDGGSRRVVLSYKKDVPVDQRVWTQRVVGGFHKAWQGKGAEWLEWARAEYSIAGSGRLVGNRLHPDCPLAAVFWWECDSVVRGAKREVGVEEARFVFDKLLGIESEYPVSHFVASDGSRKEGDEESPGPRVGRVAISVSKEDVKVMGGRMEVEARGFDRHSFEAETEAFLDHLADCEDSVSVFVTDCLSGSQAGTNFRSRTDAGKAGCYREVELDNVHALEAKHRAVIYMWVHSHVGITPNEAADVLADGMRDGDVWSELRLAPSRFQLARVRGLLSAGWGRQSSRWHKAWSLASWRRE